MQRKFSGFVLFVIVLLSVFSWSCTKVDTTTLGADLIPAVDNVSTFDTVININATQGFFNDETKLGRTENHLVGNITNDPVFGKTNAEIFVELKPGFFPYYFGAAGDTINPIANPATEGFDSVILCLSVKGFYGDTNIAQHLKVYALDQSTSNFKDSAYMLNFLPTPSYLGSTEIGNAIVSPKPTDLAKYNYFNITNTKKDSSTNQIRIKLDGNYMGQTFLKALTANTDTTNASFPYYSDNNFKTLFKGFAITGDNTANGNGLFYINLAEANTRLEVYYHSRKKDTSYSAFTLNSSASLTITSSAHATHLERDRVTGSPEIATPQPDAIYIQSTPGTYASLKIPELSDFSKLNRIIHRAEIILEQVPGNAAIDKALAGPTYLYLDLKDTGTVEKYKTIYKDLNPATIYTPDATTLYYPSGGIDFSYFGGFIRDSYDPAFNRVYYNFNVSRYIQDMVTNHIPNYEIRVYAPYNLTYNGTTFPFPNSALFLANGRVKIGNGNNPNYKLRMRIVYSKFKEKLQSLCNFYGGLRLQPTPLSLHLKK